MGFICLECFKKKYPNSKYLNEYGLFDMSLVAVCTDICEICVKKTDCIDNFYDKEELQDLFTEIKSNLIEEVMHLEDFTSYYNEALEGKNIGIYAEEIPKKRGIQNTMKLRLKLRKLKNLFRIS